MNIAVQIPDQLHEQFARHARERYGENGSEKALQEAIALWLESAAPSDDLRSERALNNKVYRQLKVELERKYQGKYVVIAWGALQGAGNTLAEIAQIAPGARHRLVFCAGEVPKKRRERLWRMQKS